MQTTGQVECKWVVKSMQLLIQQLKQNILCFIAVVIGTNAPQISKA
jgi:hypothetical protein